MVGGFRRLAQWLRHAPGLRNADPLWKALRRPYRALLQAGGKSGVEVSVGGTSMRLHPDFATVGWEGIETQSYQTFAAAIRPGDVVFDVGAHIGTYSILAARQAGADGLVVAFEPTPATRRYLRQHLEWNGVHERVTVREACCSDRSGTVEFFLGAEAFDAQNSLIANGRSTVQQLEATTIDEEVSRVGRPPDLIKIDVEGAEQQVLLGAKWTLNSHRPKLLLSVHPDRLPEGVTERGIVHSLEALGYRIDILARDHEVHVWAV
jgi:FkbM family methyltransferase